MTPPFSFFITSHLVFRPFEVSDLDALAEIVADPVAVRFVGDGVPLDRATVALWIERSRDNVAKYGYGTGAVIERASGRLIGWAGVARPEGEPEEIVYGLAPSAWGRGYGKEIACALVDYLLETVRVPEIRATVAPGNAASIHILEGLGFIRTSWEHDEESRLYLLRPPATSDAQP